LNEDKKGARFMQTIRVEIEGNYARSPAAEIVCGNSDYFIEFAFSEEWNEHRVKTARFFFANSTVDRVFEGNVVQVPIIKDATVLEVGVYAGNLHTTTPALIGCKKSILCRDAVPEEPSEDVYNQIIELLSAINKGGTSVTIEGEAQETFPADTYIAARLAALVNSAPATLDTLAEIATALGNDPNFATTIIAELGKKIDKVEPHWNSNGVVAVKKDGTYFVYPVYGTKEAYTLAYREAGGVIRVGTAVGNDDAVPLAQLNEMLDERIGDIAAALDEVHAYAQALKGGAN
jgi:hypothetical protein